MLQIALQQTLPKLNQEVYEVEDLPLFVEWKQALKTILYIVFIN